LAIAPDETSRGDPCRVRGGKGFNSRAYPEHNAAPLPFNGHISAQPSKFSMAGKRSMHSRKELGKGGQYEFQPV
jgi:hypothetical protein